MFQRAKRPFPWHRSLLFRVLSLCVVLLLLLFGSLYAMTRFYFHQLVTVMEERTQGIASDVKLFLDTNLPHDPNAEPTIADYKGVLRDLEAQNDGVTLELQPLSDPEEPRISPKLGQGYFMEATRTVESNNQIYRLVAQFEIKPQTELVMAYRNKYLLASMLGFVAVLVLMVYFIVKALRPLSDLAESCADIGAGNLRTVEVKQNYGEILELEQTFNRMVSSLRDKEKMETSLRQAQRLSALGNLAAGVAHDLRNPLNAIKLLSSHALDNIGGGEDAPQAAKQLRTIRSEVDRLEEIVSSFLALTKERELQFAPACIDRILEECLDLVRKDAELRDIRLLSELRAGETALMLDEKNIRRAIINVLINAMEACRKGGRVRLFSRLTETECEIEVRDDGAGMDKETLERAFEPYYTTKNTGTGLGLAITRGIVEEHGGKIELSSTLGEGSQVLIRLPLERR